MPCYPAVVRLPSLSVLVPLALLACRAEPTSTAQASGASPRAILGARASASSCAPVPESDGVRGAFIGTRFGPFSLHERTASGAEAPLSTDALRRCDPGAPRLMVARLDAPWCAPCTASVDRYAAVLSSFGKSLVALDVVFSGVDNGPTRPEELTEWCAAYPRLPGHVTRADDAATADVLRFQHASPTVFLVELPSMRIVDVLANPTSDNVDGRIRRALSALSVSVPVPPPVVAPLVDGRFTPEDWAVLQGMRAGDGPPPDPTNAHADDPAAAELGRELFLDVGLGGGSVACVTCHAPDLAFSDGRATGRGAGTSEVNTLGLGPAAYNRWWFWDGRADSLWAQATSPLENPREMAGTRLGLAHRMVDRHRARYESVFGALPDLAQTDRFPASGKPGDPPYDGMLPDDKRAVSRVFVNAVKAIAAYERTLRPRRSRFDDYLGGDTEALTPRERDGMKVFLQGGCAICHGGPMLTDGAFHDIHMPSSSPTGPALRGRVDGVRALLASEFRADGPFSDAPDAGGRLGTLAPSAVLLGQVKTPSLRDLTRTAPFGHGGTFKTLEAAIGHYDQDDLTDTSVATAGVLDPAVVAFSPSAQDLDALIAFLSAVGGEPAARDR